MKKILALALAVVMVFGLMSVAASAEDKITINMWSFSTEMEKLMTKYLELNPDLAEKVEIVPTMINNDGNAYTNAIDTALMNGEVDLYGAEADYVFKYAQGDMAEYAASYAELGIDVETALADAEIADYTIEIGTRPSDSALVGLGYQATGGAFIYRRSIAKDVWGTDDPATIAEKIGAGTQSWDTFFTAAEELKAKGYKIVSGKGDVWNVIKTASETGWVVDGALNIDPMREEYMDIAKKLMDNGYMNDTSTWGEAWYTDMTASSDVFAFYGPAWLLNYTIGANCGEGDNSSNGDWAVCESNVGFFWGGTWLMASETILDDPEKTEFIKGFIEWVTLDTSDTGLQYLWANGLMNDAGTKDTVASSVVMAKSNGESDFLSGQNMFEVFIPANENATGKAMTQYDSVINGLFDDAVSQYVSGAMSKEDAIDLFKSNVESNLDVVVEY